MNISNNDSGIRQSDKNLISAMFNTVASTLESLEEYRSGTFSTQQKLMELKQLILDFVSAYKNRNTIFYVFLNKETENNLKIVVTSLLDEPDETTKRVAIIIDRNLKDFKVKQLSLSSKMLTLIQEYNG